MISTLSFNLTNFDSVLALVDDALKSATKAVTKTSIEADEKFRKAVEILSDYEMECHPTVGVSNGGRVETVVERMVKAMENDNSTSTILDKLKEKAVNFMVRGECAAAF